MQEARNESSNEKEHLAGEVNDGLGTSGIKEEAQEAHSDNHEENINDPLYVQKRLKRQERTHQRQLGELRGQLQAMQSQMANGQPQSASYSQQNNPYQNSNHVPGSVEDTVHKAVSMALNARDEQDRRAKDAEKAAYIANQYQKLNSKLDRGSNKYDDFDDVVRSNNVPFTTHMRDAALMFPHDNADDVFYKLGKNPDELKRIASLHPLDQAQEMVKLSVALNNGGNAKESTAPRPIGQIKSNPINSPSVTDTTPPSEIRRRMKAGSWK